jgi:glutamate-1-semialdehyde 2,1-aminomutase
MELGGLRTDHDRVFLLSTTHGGETSSLAAGLATVEAYMKRDVIGHLQTVGERLRVGINDAARALGIDQSFRVIGHPANLIYTTRDERGESSQAFRTLFLQETIQRGLLMPSLVVNFSHGDQEVRATIEGVSAALEIYRDALEQGIDRYLVGRPVQPAIRRHA